MKKLLFSAWLLMLSMAAAAQTFVVVDKNGNRVAYDVSRLDSVTFQQSPPAFTVYEVVDDGNDGQDQEEPTVEVTQYTFDKVKGFAGEPHFLFAHPDTVYVDAEGQDFAFQLHADVGYDYKPSDAWLTYMTAIDATDSLRFAAGMNPSTTERTAYIAFVSKDEQQRDTLWIVQAGKNDSRYIDIDWTQTTLDNFNEQSGTAQLTFAGDVPVMGDYDVVLLPKDDSYVIRIIDQVQQTPGSKTVTLATRAGLMGNLFKGQKFTLATEAGAQGVKRFGSSSQYDDAPVYLPTKVEIFNGDEYVEVFNADKPAGHGRKAPQGFENEFINWEYNKDGMPLWQSGNQSLSWDKFNFSLGLKGLFSFDFGDIPWEKVRMGDLKNLRIALEGGFDMELVMKYLVSASVEWKKEWEIAKDAFKAKYTFMVGTTPVYISVNGDLMAEVDLGASGEASVTAGIKASSTVTYGIEWDAVKGISKIAECEKNMEMVGPDVDIHAHAEARATAYPKFDIGIYKVLCPTISPQLYLKAEADARLVDNSKVAWNAGISTGLDLGLGLCLDLFFWEINLGEIDPVNVFDVPLVKLPNEIHLFNEQEQPVLINGTKEVRYHVTHMNYLTGKYTPAKNVLVHFEPEGGEVEDEYVYTDAEGDVSAFFKLTDIDGGKLKAEVVLGAEPENEEDAMKAEDWNAVAIDYRLIATPAEQTIEKDAESAAISYKLEQYSSKVKYWWGLRDKTIYFEATGGTCNNSAVTNENGIAVATFTPNEDFTEGSVTGTITIPAPSPWSGEQTAKIYVKDDDIGDITDEGLKKAAKQKPNVYVVENKNTGENQTRNYVTKWSEWNKDQDAIQFSLEDADENGMTQGMIWGFIPLTMTDVVLALTSEQFANSPGMKFGFDIYEGQQVSGDFMSMTDMTEGNIKPESRIMLRKVKSGSNNTPRRAPDEEYTGEYELLFYLVFTNKTWNPETNEMEEGDDYEVYGRGTMKMHLPTITSFVLGYDKDWVKVGESTKVTIESFYEEGATWDWNDVQLIGQSTDYTNARNGEDEGFFSWDATTQMLTALKSNDNNRVYVCLGLISNPAVKHTLMIATGNGWKYTMIGTSKEEITCKANSYPSFDMVWAPKDSDSERFDFNSVELAPDCAPEGYFQFPTSYARQGWPLFVSSNALPGEYNLKFRLKSDHSVYCTLKVIVTEGE